MGSIGKDEERPAAAQDSRAPTASIQVLAVAKDKQPDELIFYPASHRTFHAQYYVVRVKRLCRLAGVPEVVPHSLRGLHATLALEGGATADAVAKALGHSSFAMTAQHYASPSSVANSRSSRGRRTSADHQAERINVISLLKTCHQNLLALLDGLESMGTGSRSF